ncbi:MAG: hypothetical protein A3E78_00410 [Alphaproteobacteria bacterium RIFCSPHIGHO2_12_FULL_63_12]|nr:MAG: hypothetical protein A3E78_00410 [Alphaproteobacteria bacterium RIFCSPHIGHO2_12_FULL_63_12]
MASGVATIYCFVLSRRLSRLNDTKNGIGASIASMSQALDQTQQTLAVARSSSVDAIQKLTNALEDAERIRPEFEKLIDEFGALAELAITDIDRAKEKALQQIDSRNFALRKADTSMIAKMNKTAAPGAPTGRAA